MSEHPMVTVHKAMMAVLRREKDEIERQEALESLLERVAVRKFEASDLTTPDPDRMMVST